MYKTEHVISNICRIWTTKELQCDSQQRQQSFLVTRASRQPLKPTSGTHPTSYLKASSSCFSIKLGQGLSFLQSCSFHRWQGTEIRWLNSNANVSSMSLTTLLLSFLWPLKGPVMSYVSLSVSPSNRLKNTIYYTILYYIILQNTILNYNIL